MKFIRPLLMPLSGVVFGACVLFGSGAPNSAFADMRCRMAVRPVAESDLLRLSIVFSLPIRQAPRSFEVSGGAIVSARRQGRAPRIRVKRIDASRRKYQALLQPNSLAGEVRVTLPASSVRSRKTGTKNQACSAEYRGVAPSPSVPGSSTPAVTPQAPAAPTASGSQPPGVLPTASATSRIGSESPTPSSSREIPTVASPTPIPAASPRSEQPYAPLPPALGERCSPSDEARTATLPAFPDAVGFGRFALGGSGRNQSRPCTNIIRVRSLADQGPETLRACVEAKGPRVCVFEVGGQIWSTKDLRVTSPYLTIAGQTAPYPGIVIRGAPLVIEASDVIVRHIRFRVGDDPRDPCCAKNKCSAAVAPLCTSDPGSRDGLRVASNSRAISNVLIDHVSISWALDEGLSIVPNKGDISNVTFSNSIISYGLDLSIHPEAPIATDPGHSKGVLVNGARALSNFSFIRNMMVNNADRNIRIATPVSMEFINNLVYNWGRGRGAGRTIELTNKGKVLHLIDLVNNLYIPGPETFCPGNLYRPELCAENGGDGLDSNDERLRMHFMLRVGSGISSGLVTQSRYFLSGNIGPTRPNLLMDEWAVADRSFFVPKTSTLLFPSNRATSSVASSQTVVPAGAVDLPHMLVADSGATPWDRDVVDRQSVDDVMNGKGRIINCVAPDGTARCEKNAGGWPHYPATKRALPIPANPHADDDGDGYTNLENWLDALGK